MTQTSNRLFDELARLMTDAAGVARGVREEAESVFRSQAEKVLRDLDIVQREEFEAVREMAVRAREENERLAARIAELESRLGEAKRKPAAPRKPAATAKSPRGARGGTGTGNAPPA